MTDEILKIMSLSKEASDIQRIQTAHRLRLIDFWGIEKGARVLEIGCGQGDTLTALAFVVGEKGFVHGIDNAKEDYGAPETLGQARERILNSKIGKNTAIDLNCNIMDDPVCFKENEFDYVVLSHCLWYFADLNELEAILKRIRPWSKKLCIAEWDPRITRFSQFVHFEAVTVQAVCESFKRESESNIRTVFYPSDIKIAAEKSGWHTEREGTVDSPDMQDGRWERGTAVGFYPNEIAAISEMPEKLKQLLLSKIDFIKNADEIEPMSVFCCVCGK